jgi:hypothetical protein
MLGIRLLRGDVEAGPGEAARVVYEFVVLGPRGEVRRCGPSRPGVS